MSDLKVQSLMWATDVTVDCPNCNNPQSGFFNNPAGGEFDCDDCGQKYKVHADADIEHR